MKKLIKNIAKAICQQIFNNHFHCSINDIRDNEKSKLTVSQIKDCLKDVDNRIQRIEVEILYPYLDNRKLFSVIKLDVFYTENGSTFHSVVILEDKGASEFLATYYGYTEFNMKHIALQLENRDATFIDVHNSQTDKIKIAFPQLNKGYVERLRGLVRR